MSGKYEGNTDFWDDDVPERWAYYGVPDSWIAPIDKLLDEIFAVNKDARLRQIKVKFGELRLYMSNLTEEQRQSVRWLESSLTMIEPQPF